MFKKVLRIVLFLIIAMIFVRAIMVLSGYGDMENVDGDVVAVIDFKGQIIESETFLTKLKALEMKDNVKGIIIRVNSPGGAVAPSNEIYDYIVTMKKPVYAAMGTVAASGGYMISLGANKIYAMPSTITGSIGVIMSFMNTEGLFEKIGVYSVVLKSGKYKDIGNPDRPLTEDERLVMMQVIDDMFDQFVSIVSARRNMEKEEVLKIADGRIVTGRMALGLKLVDNLGSWRDAYLDMASVLNIPNLKYYEVKEKKKWWEEVMDTSAAFRRALTPHTGLYYLAEVY